MKRLAMTLSGLAFVVSLAACGGDSEAGGAKGRFIADGDAICRETIAQVNAIGNGTDTATLEKARDAWAQTWTKMDALPTPHDGEAKALEFKANIHNASLTADAAYQASLSGGSQQRVQDAGQTLTDVRKKAAETADDYGFKVCTDL